MKIQIYIYVYIYIYLGWMVLENIMIKIRKYGLVYSLMEKAIP